MNEQAIESSLTIESVEKRFRAWRDGRAKREPIPEPLWQAAAGLCRHHPITRICRHLRLSFTDLKKRVSTLNSVPVQFMDLDMGCFTGSWHMECERADGSKLRISGNGQVPAVEHLLMRFLS